MRDLLDQPLEGEMRTKHKLMRLEVELNTFDDKLEYVVSAVADDLSLQRHGTALYPELLALERVPIAATSMAREFSDLYRQFREIQLATSVSVVLVATDC